MNALVPVEERYIVVELEDNGGGGVAVPTNAQGPDISDSEMIAMFPGHEIDHDNKRFYRGWLERRLLMNRCAACGRWHHPPQPLCPECWSVDVSPTEVTGRGVIHLLIALHQGPLAAGVDYATRPYPVVVVELQEQAGLRYTSTIVNYDAGDLRIGAPVELIWIDRSGIPFPAFQPAAR
jgi:uncharacterized OB-fold protein